MAPSILFLKYALNMGSMDNLKFQDDRPHSPLYFPKISLEGTQIPKSKGTSTAIIYL